MVTLQLSSEDDVIYIYALRCPVERTVRYIGKSENPQKRHKSHISAARCGATKHQCADWIRRLHAQGFEPELHVLAQVPEGIRWQDVERSYIANAKSAGWNLLNSTQGGDGVPLTDDAARERWIASLKRTKARPEYRGRASAAMKEVQARPEVKERNSASTKEAWADTATRAKMIAGAMRPEVRKSKSAKLRMRNADPAFAAKHAATMKSIWNAPGRSSEQSDRALTAHANHEITARRTASLREAAKRPATHAKMSAAAKEINARPGMKSIKSEKTRAQWADPEGRAKRMKGMSAPEVKVRQSEAKKLAWADPERRARLLEAQNSGRAAKRASMCAARAAMWADPVKRAKFITDQKAAWVRRRAKAALNNGP